MQWFLQTVLVGLTLLLAMWVRLPAVALTGFGLVVTALFSRALRPQSGSMWINGVALAALWIGTFTVWIGVALSNFTWDFYYAALAALMAGAVWLATRRQNDNNWKTRWNVVTTAWLSCAAFVWLGAGYFQNQRREFYAGLLATLAVLALCRLWFHWSAVGAQAINTVILVLVGLPVVDAAIRPQSRLVVRPETCRRFYSYDAAKGDPSAFERWGEYYTSQLDRLGRDVFTAVPSSMLPFRLRPGSVGMMVNCPVRINSLGFRGPEFSASKDGAYRIVALGESTTFGMTIQAEDKPWPEMLEQIIRQRLKTRRPVQVINAGVPAYNISNSLYRLPREILPLHPDMILSYHGANGFYLIDKSVLPPMGPVPPVYRERPVKLAADAEHRLRMLLFRYHARQRNVSATPPVPPLNTQYAAAYRQLIQCARTNGVRLALANFSMAVNPDSDPSVIAFYMGGGARSAQAFVRANAVHSLIVSQLAAEHPEVCFVDTHPHLDGDHEKFIDVIHLTDEGRRQLAENIFAGIRHTLEQDLAQP